MKIYVAAVEALRNKEKTGYETQYTTKIDGFLSFIPPWMLMNFLKNLTLCMTKLRVLVLCFCNSIVCSSRNHSKVSLVVFESTSWHSRCFPQLKGHSPQFKQKPVVLYTVEGLLYWASPHFQATAQVCSTQGCRPLYIKTWFWFV